MLDGFSSVRWLPLQSQLYTRLLLLLHLHLDRGLVGMFDGQAPDIEMVADGGDDVVLSMTA